MTWKPVAVAPAWLLVERQLSLSHDDFLCRSVHSQVHILSAALPLTHPGKYIQGSWINFPKQVLRRTGMVLTYKSRIHKTKPTCFQGSLLNISDYNVLVQGG